MTDLRTKDPAARARKLADHLHGKNCQRSREASECVRRVIVELLADASVRHASAVQAHEEGR